MFYREQLPSGNVVISDDSGKVRIFKNNTDANYWEYNNNPGFSSRISCILGKMKYQDYTVKEKLPELTPREQIEKMFSKVLIPNL